MRISTIIPVCNGEPYIGPALDSVFGQTLPPDEVVVVDDGSTDNTPDTLRRYAEQQAKGRMIVISQKNLGTGHALNAGVSAATGDALAFLDADDLWEPDKLEIQRAALLADEGLEAVFGYIQQFISPELDPEISQKFIVSKDPQAGINKITLLIHRAAFERIGPFGVDADGADFIDWYARADLLGLRFRMLPSVVALRRHHAANFGRQRRAEEHGAILQALKSSLDRRRKSRKPS
jgi:glycosyltransferase involved in cell wall biosynthesis